MRMVYSISQQVTPGVAALQVSTGDLPAGARIVSGGYDVSDGSGTTKVLMCRPSFNTTAGVDYLNGWYLQVNNTDTVNRWVLLYVVWE